MQTFSTTQAREQLADVINQAQREPVMIQRQNKEVAVMLSPAGYRKLHNLQVDDLMHICQQAGDYATEQGLEETILQTLLKHDISE